MILTVLVRAAEPLRVAWQQVPLVCTGRTALVKLSGGTHIEGRLMSVSPASFEMEVQRTNNERDVPKGLRSLPRASIVGLRVREKRIKGRVIGTLAGFMFAGSTVYSMSAGVAMAVGLPVYVAVLAAGHLAGQSFDNRSREVLFEPEGATSGAGPTAGETLVCEAEDVHGDAHSDQH